MYRDLCADEAYNLLKNGRHGVAEDVHGHIYLAPIIGKFTLRTEYNLFSQKLVEAYGRAVDVNNSHVLVVDGVPILFATGCAFYLKDGERETLEKKLGFRIPKGKCGVNLSHEELEELGLKIDFEDENSKARSEHFV